MNFNIYRRAFSLTELMIVMVILTILMAAMAPIFTKRHAASAPTTDSVWNYVSGTNNAYYDSGIKHLSSTAYIGVNPSRLPNSEKSNPFAKVVIAANSDQNHIQFRYGYDLGGALAGVFSVDNKNSMYTGSKPKTTGTNYTSAGVGASAQMTKDSQYTVAIGANALGVGVNSINNSVAVGVNSGQYLPKDGANNNVTVGANSGTPKYASNDVIVGANILTDNISQRAANGVYVGAGVANQGFTSASGQNLYNVILGSVYTNNVVNYSTLAGYSTVADSIINVNNSKDTMFTAAGKNACRALSPTSPQNNITCLGTGSAGGEDTGSGVVGVAPPLIKEQIYIGGKPKGFDGNAVLEIYNDFGASNSVPTVVLNSNLVVRGNFYYPNSTGDLSYHNLTGINFASSIPSSTNSYLEQFLELGYSSSPGYYPESLVSDMSALINHLPEIFSSGNTNTYYISNMLDVSENFTFGSDKYPYMRVIDFNTFSALQIPKDDGKGGKCSMQGSYPVSIDDECPNLRLSDLRLKDIISENTDSFSKVLNIKPYDYTFKADLTNTPQVGVMAQDLQKYLPNSVSKGEDGYLRIRWDEMFFALINSIKELAGRLYAYIRDVDLLEQDAQTLATQQKLVQKRIDKLNKRLEKLENN